MNLIFYWYEGYAPCRLSLLYKVKQESLVINPEKQLNAYKLQTDAHTILSFRPIPFKINISDLELGLASLEKGKGVFSISHEDICQLDSLLLTEKKLSENRKKAILQKANELSELSSDSLLSLFCSHSINTCIGTIELYVEYSKNVFIKVEPILNFTGVPWIITTDTGSYKVDYKSIIRFLSSIKLDKSLFLLPKEDLIEEVCMDILERGELFR